MEDELRFYVAGGSRWGREPLQTPASDEASPERPTAPSPLPGDAGPATDDELRDALRAGRLDPHALVRFAGTDLWAPARAWATFGARTSLSDPPPAPGSIAEELSPELAGSPLFVREMLLYWLNEGARSFGPLTGEQIRGGLTAGSYRKASASVVGDERWYRVGQLFERPDDASTGRPPAPFPSSKNGLSRSGRERPQFPASGDATSASRPSLSTRCSVCLEVTPLGLDLCQACGEPRLAGPASGPPSVTDEPPGRSWLGMHWRPLVTLGALLTIVGTGIGLRTLAPGRFLPPHAVHPAAATPAATCAAACWTGEACQLGHCVWQKPNDVGHVGGEGRDAAGVAVPPAAPVQVSGPFPLPKDVSDVLPLDAERFAVALLTGIAIHNTRTGEVLSLVSEAPQVRRLYRVGKVVYATAPSRIYVIDAATTRLLKTIELGATVGEVTLGASGRRALASLPGAHAVAILATEYHAEIDRIQFGDDAVGPTGTDDTGRRALTTTGQVPLPGLRDPAGGAVYAFDPSRLASAQDRVRASMLGNPVSVLMAPDGGTSYVALRAEDAIVPLEWLPSGAVRQLERIPTCREPEQIELVRRGRWAIVRCNEGRAIQMLDLDKRAIVRRLDFDEALEAPRGTAAPPRTLPGNARAADLVVSPDGEQAIVALPGTPLGARFADPASTAGPGEGTGAVALVDLKTYEVKVLPLNAEPTRVRLAPDGSTALVLSDRAKVAWVIR